VVRKAAFYQKPADSLKLLFDFVESLPKGQLVSAHQTKKDDFDFVFYVPLYQSKIKDLLRDQWSQLKTDEREFNGYKIHELTTKGQIFSWAEVDDIWVGSFTPFLIEDVIRTYTGDGSTFKKQIESVYQLPRVKDDAGNLYIHIKNFGNWLSSFAELPTNFVKQVGHSSLLDIKTTDQALTLNGFSLDSASQGFILSLFNNQVPVPFTAKGYVSHRSIMVTSYGISDGAKFGEALQQYVTARKPSLRDSIARINTEAGVNLSDLYSSLGKELTVCYLEGNNSNLSKIVLAETSKPEAWISTLNTIAKKTSLDTVFFERFSDYEIREIAQPGFPGKLLYPFISSGFSSCYYTSVGHTIIMGENVEDLKQFLDDIDKEETWGKSVAQNQFLETTLLESNFSVFINTPLAWNMVSNALHPKWQGFIQENKNTLRAIDMGAIQMSHLNNSYYTNVTWKFGQSRGEKTPAAEKSDKLISSFPQGIHKFFVVRNHFTKQEEVLVQDSSKTVSLVSPDGKVQWTINPDSYITGDVSQVDFFRNGKLQFFFATAGHLHVVDRLGNYVKPYPLAITEKDIEFTSIVDYDHSKKYRFLVAGRSGKLWMYDKEGNNLDGWKPKNAEGSFSAAPQHYRIRGKDYVVAVRKDGIAYLMTRRGETLAGFPLNLDARPVGDVALETGSSTGNTYFVIVSRDGFRIKFNLEGKVVSREALIKTVADSRFSLVREMNEKAYLVVRQEARQLTIMDQELKEIITSDFIGNNAADIRYYNFGSGKIYITVTDKSQDLSFVYDAQGKLVTTLPVESNELIVRPADASRIKTYSSLGKALTVQQ
jgi:hypothetical protein